MACQFCMWVGSRDYSLYPLQACVLCFASWMLKYGALSYLCIVSEGGHSSTPKSLKKAVETSDFDTIFLATKEYPQRPIYSFMDFGGNLVRGSKRSWAMKDEISIRILFEMWLFFTRTRIQTLEQTNNKMNVKTNFTLLNSFLSSMACVLSSIAQIFLSPYRKSVEN